WKSQTRLCLMKQRQRQKQ
ncbi:glycine cleavage system P-family protein, partial [Vibrio parahaemolyticus V-223/04]